MDIVLIVLITLAIFLLMRAVRRLEDRVAYLEEQEFDARVGKLFNFLTEGLDPEDDE
jgi:hypothetical protein